MILFVLLSVEERKVLSRKCSLLHWDAEENTKKGDGPENPSLDFQTKLMGKLGFDIMDVSNVVMAGKTCDFHFNGPPAS